MRKIKAILLASHGIGAYALKWDNPSRTVSPRWEAEVARDYKVVGPFPQEAREQHFLSPARPLGSKIMLPLDYEGSFPSHLADGGFVLWKGSSVSTESAGMEVSHYKKPNVVHYSIAFPEVRWGSIRATEGWSGLQHHALLHTKIRLTPPRTHAHIPPVEPIYLVLSASQCSYFAILGFKSELSTPQWYTCNIYDHANVPPIRIPLKPYLDSHLRRQTFLEPTTEIMELNVLMSLDYEIRLFGDPAVSNNGTMPIIEADFSVEVEGSSGQNLAEGTGNEIVGSPIFERNQLSLSQDSLGRHTHCMRTNPNAHIFPHFVAGWAYGEAVGIEISSCSKEAWSISLGPSSIDGWATNEIHLELVEPTRIAPSQTRLVSMRLTQAKRLTIPNASLTLELRLRPENNSHSKAQTISVTIPIQNHPSLSQPSEDTQGILLTYHSVSGTPASAVVLPPPNESHQITSRSRILLALHGAGVMHTHSFWISALPRPEHAWVLVVQGLTPWGLDWREASRADVCAALRALVLQLVGIWREADYCTTHDLITEVVLPKRPSAPVEAIPVVAIGHSNGGQGSLHLASLFPDGIPALIPAAGYTSARLYVSTQVSRGSLFADAALQGIMRASLQGQDGDIVAGNLVLSRVHLVHGGNDENVPVWHSRERMTLIKTWHSIADVEMTEVPDKPHFWDLVFKDESVSSAIEDLITSPYANLNTRNSPFTLTVAWPLESGSMRGWRIREAIIPGRLSRIRVNGNSIRTTNVHVFSLELSKSGLTADEFIMLDHKQIKIPRQSHVWFHHTNDNAWEITKPIVPYSSGPLSRILTTARPITLVIPVEHAEYYEAIALRIAHNLYTYLKLDCIILRDFEVEGSVLEGRSVVVIGGSHNQYGMAVRSGPLRVSFDGSISVGGEKYSGVGIGALSLHKSHLYMDASDFSGYERILRMFPLRTGVPGPEWMIIGPDCDAKGYGGVLAAGFWDRNGELSEITSYFA